MMEDSNYDKDNGGGLVYGVGVLIFALSAMAFFTNLQWILLSIQRSAFPTMIPKELTEQVQTLEILEEQIPFFHHWLYYGLVLHTGLIISAVGLLRFNEKARKAAQCFFGLDAFVFLALAIYYKATGYTPRIAEQFQMRATIAVSRIVFLMFLGSPTFMKAFQKQKSDSSTDADRREN